MRTDHTFCCLYLKSILEDVRQHLSPEEIKKAWVYHSSFTDYEFHFGDFYAHGLSGADCVASAKAEGWLEWLAKYFPEAEDN